MVKNLPVNAEDIRNASLIPGLKRSLGEGNSKPLQYSCLENSTDRGAWWATVHRVARSRTQLSNLGHVHVLTHTHTHTHTHLERLTCKSINSHTCIDVCMHFCFFMLVYFLL